MDIILTKMKWAMEKEQEKGIIVLITTNVTLAK